MRDPVVARLLRLWKRHGGDSSVTEVYNVAGRTTARCESILHEIAHYVGVHGPLPERLSRARMDYLDSYIQEWPEPQRNDDEAITVGATALCMAALGMQTPELWDIQVRVAVANVRLVREGYLRARILDDDILGQAQSRALHILAWLYRHPTS